MAHQKLQLLQVETDQIWSQNHKGWSRIQQTGHSGSFQDGNGSIDFREFMLATDMTTAGTPEEKLRWAFKVDHN